MDSYRILEYDAVYCVIKASQKPCYVSTKERGITSQKTVIFAFKIARTLECPM